MHARDGLAHQFSGRVVCAGHDGVEFALERVSVAQGLILEAWRLLVSLELPEDLGSIDRIQVSGKSDSAQERVQCFICCSHGFRNFHAMKVASMTELGAPLLNIDTIGALDGHDVYELLPLWLGGFVDAEPEVVESVIESVAAALSNFAVAEVQRTVNRIQTIGSEYAFFEADPVARAVMRTFVRSLVLESKLKGAERLAAANQSGPVLILSNHLSYCDAQITDLLLVDGGFSAQANRLIAVAGPKVYGTLFRRLASLGLGTIKTAQSSNLAHNHTGMTTRQVASAAMHSVGLSHEHMDVGGLVVLYGEGARSRTARFGSFLKAVRRYARKNQLTLMPVALSGTNRLMPLDLSKMCPASVNVEFGYPIDVAEHGALLAIEKAWYQIAEVLPREHRPESGCAPVG
jgi:1-acyl-sn-glycerol-3-phosphate acyltransferase